MRSNSRLQGALLIGWSSQPYALPPISGEAPVEILGIRVPTQGFWIVGNRWTSRARHQMPVKCPSCKHKVRVKRAHAASDKPFGMNWKMTAKTILVQLNHKIATFDHLSKRLVLVLQDCLLDYMRREFAFDHVKGVRDGDPMQFHAYELRKEAASYALKLKERISTDTAGIAMCLGLQADTKVELRTSMA